MTMEALIEAVKKRRALYDKEDRNYTNRLLINRLWKEVADEVGMRDMIARKKWSVLKDSLKRHLRRQATFKLGDGGKNYKTWYLYNSMMFLRPYVEDRHSVISSKPAGHPDNEDDDSERQNASSQLEDTKSPNNSFSFLSPNSPRPLLGDYQANPSCSKNAIIKPHRTRPRKRKRPVSQERPIATSTYDKEMLNALRQLNQPPQKLVAEEKDMPTIDGDENFLLSLLPVLKSLDPVSKLECRGEFNTTALRYLQRSPHPSQYRPLGILPHPQNPTYHQTSPPRNTTDGFYQQYATNIPTPNYRSFPKSIQGDTYQYQSTATISMIDNV